MNAFEMTGVKKCFPKSAFTLELAYMEAPEGYITGFIGENGAGKTTTIKLLMGMLFPNEGEITIFGLDAQKEGKKIRQQIGYVGEQTGYLEQAKLKNLYRMVAPFYKNWDEMAFKRYIDRFGLDLNVRYKSLSKGKQKQFSIAMALSHHPRLLLMDEPTANLDPLVRQEILDILADELQNEGISVFFSTHITSDLDKIADYVQFLHAGKLILTDDKESLLSRHRIIKGRTELLTPELEQKCIYTDRSEFGFRALTEHYPDCYALLGREAIYEVPTIEDIFIGYTKRGGKSK